MPKDTISRTSTRVQVEPGLNPSGLTVQARPTGMAIPHGDYRPKMNPNHALISQAFLTLAGYAADKHREQRKVEYAAGRAAMVERGEAALTDPDLEDRRKSKDFLKGLQWQQGVAGGRKAANDLNAILDNNPDAFPTQASWQKAMHERMQADLQGVPEDSPMRQGYLETMAQYEPRLTEENAMHNAAVAQQGITADYAEVAGKIWDDALNSGGDLKQNLNTAFSAMNEHGSMMGVSIEDRRKIQLRLVENYVAETGDETAYEALNMPIMDVDNPDGKGIPGTGQVPAFAGTIEESKARALRKYDSDQNEEHQKRYMAYDDSFFALTKEGKFAEAEELTRKEYLNGTISDGQYNSRMDHLRDTRNNDAALTKLDELADDNNWPAIKLATGTDAKFKAYMTGRHSKRLAKAAESGDPSEVMTAHRLNIREMAESGVVSKPYEVFFEAPPSDGKNWETGRLLWKTASGPDRDVILANMKDDQLARYLLADKLEATGADPETVYQIVRGYGSPEAQKESDKYISKGDWKDVDAVFDDNMTRHDPSWAPFNEYQMAPDPGAREAFRARVATMVRGSAGLITAREAAEFIIEQQKATNHPYRPGGQEMGVHVFVGPSDGDPKETQEMLDWYFEEKGIPQINAEYEAKWHQKSAEAAVAGGPEPPIDYLPAFTKESGLHPRFQQGVGWVVYDAAGRVVTRTGKDKAGNDITVPWIIPSMQDLRRAYRNRNAMTKEQALSKHEEGRLKREGEQKFQEGRALRHRRSKEAAEAEKARRKERLAAEDKARKEMMKPAEEMAERSGKGGIFSGIPESKTSDNPARRQRKRNRNKKN